MTVVVNHLRACMNLVKLLSKTFYNHFSRSYFHIELHKVHKVHKRPVVQQFGFPSFVTNCDHSRALVGLATTSPVPVVTPFVVNRDQFRGPK